MGALCCTGMLLGPNKSKIYIQSENERLIITTKKNDWMLNRQSDYLNER